ncbi:voltage-gated potassium channel [Aureococcus anophagefferens]|nr:voltage-gated potassium channel [Aureococcus anophagefferens]
MPSRAMKKKQSSGGSKGRGVAHALLRRTKSSSGDVVANALTVSPFTTSLTSLEASLANVGLVVALAPDVRPAASVRPAPPASTVARARSSAEERIPAPDADRAPQADTGDEVAEARRSSGPWPTRRTPRIESSRSKRWYGRNVERAKLFFGVVPGHDDPDANVLPEEPRGWVPMISPTGNGRVAWDLLIAIFLLYITMVEPLSLSFLPDAVLAWGTPLGTINRVVDVVFLVDICLNMRTGYVNEDKALVMDPKLARTAYLQSWFPLDFVSSMPPVIEVVMFAAKSSSSGGSGARIVRLARVLKISKLLRLAKLMKLTDRDSAFADSVEDFMASSSSMFAVRCFSMMVASFVLAHLLACFMAVSGPGWLETYVPDGRPGARDVSPDDWYWFRQYVVAFYWAFTTMTSVGYGDVTPESDAERIYAIFAMMIGVAFYSYIIATVASMVTAADAKSVIYFERMDQLSSWMRHYKFEMSLRRRTRRFFKQFYATRSAIDERSILENLAPQLQEAVSSYLLHTFVKTHPLFSNFPEGTLWKILAIVRTIQFEPDTDVVATGSPSSALFILLSGSCECVLPRPGDVLGPGAPKVPRRRSSEKLEVPPDADGAAAETPGERVAIGPGASFGELCLLGVRASSLVTVRTLTPVECFLVQRDARLLREPPGGPRLDDREADALPQAPGPPPAEDAGPRAGPRRAPPRVRPAIVRFNSGGEPERDGALGTSSSAPGRVGSPGLGPLVRQPTL